jgi:hypothetical protein
VTLLLTAAQFGNDPCVDRRLRIEEALEIEGISHGAGLVPGSLMLNDLSAAVEAPLPRGF